MASAGQHQAVARRRPCLHPCTHREPGLSESVSSVPSTAAPGPLPQQHTLPTWIGLQRRWSTAFLSENTVTECQARSEQACNAVPTPAPASIISAAAASATRGTLRRRAPPRGASSSQPRPPLSDPAPALRSVAIAGYRGSRIPTCRASRAARCSHRLLLSPTVCCFTSPRVPSTTSATLELKIHYKLPYPVMGYVGDFH